MRAFIACAFALALMFTGAASGADTQSGIVAVVIDPVDLVSGGPVSVSIETTPDVVSVVALAGPHRVPIPEIIPGWYYGTATVPRFPRFFRGRFRVHFIGKTASGATVGADTMVRLN